MEQKVSLIDALFINYEIMLWLCCEGRKARICRTMKMVVINASSDLGIKRNQT